MSRYLHRLVVPTQDDHYEDVEEDSAGSDDDEWDYENQEPAPPPLPRKKPTPTPPVPAAVAGNSITNALKSKFDASKTDDVQTRPKLSPPGEQKRPNSRGGSGKRPVSKPPPPPPAKTIPVGQEKSHDDDVSKSHSPSSGGIADALKARFESKQNNRSSDTNKSAQFGSESSAPKPSLPPKLPSKPLSATQGQRTSRVSQNIETGSISDNLADVLKSKFEARLATSGSATENVQLPAKPDIKPHGVKPPLMGKQTPSVPHNTASPGTVATGQPLTPPKKSNTPRTPPKSPVMKKDENSDKNSSDLTSVLKAKFEARQSASQETISNDRPPAPLPKKQFPSKPVLPAKAEGGSDKRVSAGSNWSKKNSKEASESENRPVSGLASALKSKFESGDVGQKPPGISTKPGIPTKSSFGAPKPTLPSKTYNKTPSDSKPPPLAKKFNADKQSNSENVSKTQPGKIGTGNFAALRAKLEQSQTTATGSSSAAPPTNNSSEKQMGTNSVPRDSNPVSISNQFTKPPKLKSKKYVAISDFSADNEGEVNLYEGDFVEVVEKSEDWWLVKVGNEEGWAPASYIEEYDGNNNTGVISPDNDSGFTSPLGGVQESKNDFSRFKTSARFVAENEGEIGFSKGVFVEVLEQGDEGWWYISVNGQKGWAPASYIKET